MLSRRFAYASNHAVRNELRSRPSVEISKNARNAVLARTLLRYRIESNTIGSKDLASSRRFCRENLRCTQGLQAHGGEQPARHLRLFAPGERSPVVTRSSRFAPDACRQTSRCLTGLAPRDAHLAIPTNQTIHDLLEASIEAKPRSTEE
jgi:hypothetical protein